MGLLHLSTGRCNSLFACARQGRGTPTGDSPQTEAKAWTAMPQRRGSPCTSRSSPIQNLTAYAA